MVTVSPTFVEKCKSKMENGQAKIVFLEWFAFGPKRVCWKLEGQNNGQILYQTECIRRAAHVTHT